MQYSLRHPVFLQLQGVRLALVLFFIPLLFSLPHVSGSADRGGPYRGFVADRRYLLLELAYRKGVCPAKPPDLIGVAASPEYSRRAPG